MGGFSDYKEIERESTSLWHACNYHNTAEKTENQTACGLQIWLFDYKTLHFTYKSGFSFTKLYFLNTKTAFRITKWHLVLLLSKTLKLPFHFSINMLQLIQISLT